MSNEEKSNFKKKRIIIFCSCCIIVSIILSLVPIFVFQKRFGDSWKIDDGKEFMLAINNSASIQKTAKYSIIKNFELKIGDIKAHGGVNFYGELDGNGHTITIIPDDTNSSLENPIFGVIMKEASISSLNIIIDNYKQKNILKVGSDSTKSIAVLAEQNNGTIDTCSISVKDFYIGRFCEIAAVCVCKNLGEISNVALLAKITYSDSIFPWKCFMGGLVAQNFGSVEKVLADIEFTIKDEKGALPLLARDGKNEYIGYILGSFNSVNVKELYYLNNIIEKENMNKFAMKRLTDINIVNNGKEIDDVHKLLSEPSKWDIVDNQSIPRVHENEQTR